MLRTIRIGGSVNKSILPISRSTKAEQWAQELDEDFEEAIAALIEGKTPKDAIYSHPGRGGKTFTYVTGFWIARQLNALFDYNWDWKVLREHIGQTQVWVLGSLTIRLETEGGKYVTVFKEAFGGADIKMASGTSNVIDIGDDLKGASTDALKKAASLFGLAADVYGPSEGTTKDENQIAPEILTALFRRGGQLDWSEEQTREWIKKEGGAELEELTKAKVQSLLGELVKLVNAKPTQEENQTKTKQNTEKVKV